MLTMTKSTGGYIYPSPFRGPTDHTLQIDVDADIFDSEEVDADGVLKPGVPISANKTLVAALTRSTPGAGAVGVGNANGVVSAVTGGWGAPAETITVEITGTGATAAFNVYGSKSGFIGTGAVGTAFVSPIINFSMADGSTDWEPLDTYVFTVTAGVSSKVLGVTIGQQKIAASNAGAALTAAGVVRIAIATIGQVSQDVVEDVLGRSLTASEVAGFAGTPLVLF